MNEYKKFKTGQQSEEQHHQVSEQQSLQPAVHEFSGAEELLRYDAQQTPVPPAIAQRLQQSISELPAPARQSWWRRLLGSSEP